MVVYISVAKSRAYVEVLSLVTGPQGLIGDNIVQVGGVDGEDNFFGWTLDDLLELGGGKQDIEPKGRDRDDTEDEEG